VGGQDATSLVEGEGFETMIQAPKYELMDVNHRDDYVVLKYKRRVV
jgi:riboflavin biosynthesis pyrimidine reductase